MVVGRCLGITANVPQVFGCCCPPVSITLLILCLLVVDQCEQLCTPPHGHQLVGTDKKMSWGLHDFCLVVTNFHVWAIMQAQLNTLSQVMVWGDIEKPQQDMAFLLIMPSIATGCERFFGLIAVWVHPHQACYSTLEGAVCRLVPLEDRSADWEYAFVQLNEALYNTPQAVRAMSAPWQMAYPQGKPAVASASCRYTNYCSTRIWWCTWKVWKVNWKPCSWPSGSSPSGTLLSWQTCLKTTADRSGPWWHTVWECNNCHSDCPIYTDPTPTSGRHCWAFQQHHCSDKPAAHRCHEVAAGGIPHHLGLCLPVKHSGEMATSSSQRIRRSPQARGDGLCYPCPNCNPPTDVSEGSTLSFTQLPLHCSTWPCQRHLRWWASPSSNGLRPPLRVDQPACQMSFFSYRRKWTWP